MCVDDLTFRTSLPSNLRDIAGVIHSDGFENESMIIQSKMYSKLREQFRVKAKGLLQRVAETAFESIDAGVDQFLRKALRGRMPPVLRIPSIESKELEKMEKRNKLASEKLRSKTMLRLARHDCATMAIEEGNAVIYHSAKNTCRYLEAEETPIVMPLSAALSVEYLIKAYPKWTSVSDLPFEVESDSEESESSESEIQINWARELVKAGVLHTRKG